VRLTDRPPNEPDPGDVTEGLALSEARALAEALRRRALAVVRLDEGTAQGRAELALAVGGTAAGVGLLGVSLAKAGRLDAAQRVSEASDGLPREVLAMLADRSVAGELE
jgi:hypothetical protein